MKLRYMDTHLLSKKWRSSALLVLEIFSEFINPRPGILVMVFKIIRFLIFLFQFVMLSLNGLWVLINVANIIDKFVHIKIFSKFKKSLNGIFWYEEVNNWCIYYLIKDIIDTFSLIITDRSKRSMEAKVAVFLFKKYEIVLENEIKIK